MATPAITAATGRADAIMTRFRSLERARASWEPLWRECADYLLPRRNTDALPGPQGLRRRRVVDNTGSVSADRLAATLHGYLLPPFTPFAQPKLTNGEATHDEAIWFGDVENIVYRQLSTDSTFRNTVAEVMLDLAIFGWEVMAIVARRNATPTYRSVPIIQCYIDEDEETGVIDTLYRKFKLERWRAQKRWPDAAILRETKTGEKHDPQEELEFLQAVEANDGADFGAPERGGPSFNKPYHDVTLLLGAGGGDARVVDASGWDDFPFVVARFQRINNSAYGYGPGIQALPLIKGLNALRDLSILQAEYAADPPLADFTGGQLGAIDRRPGVTYPVDPTLWFGRDRPFEQLFPVGDLRSAEQIALDMRRQIQFDFYIDWLELRDGANITATEVNDRRDSRLKTLSSVTSRLEIELLVPLVERTFTLMQRAGQFPPPPESLVGQDVSFEFKSPLAQAQRLADVEGLQRLTDFVAGVTQIAPQAPENVDFDEMVRDAARRYGVPERVIRDRQLVAAQRSAAQQQQQINQTLAQAQTGASAAQQGAQAVASLQGALQ